MAVLVGAIVTTVGCRRQETPDLRPADQQQATEFRASDSSVVVLDASDFDRQVLETTRPSLVEFGSPNCAACLRMAPVLDRLGKDFENTAVVAHVDCDSERDLAERFAVRAFPVFLVFDGGEFVARLDGEQDPALLRHGLSELVADRSWPRAMDQSPRLTPEASSP